MSDLRPAQAYVPGQTPRPPEGAYDALKGTDGPLARCTAWRAGLGLLRDGYFWEAHEVLEAAWLAAPPNSAERCLVQGVIQIANARLKRNMDRPQAAARLAALAQAQLSEAFSRGGAVVLGMTRDEVAGLWGDSGLNCAI